MSTLQEFREFLSAPDNSRFNRLLPARFQLAREFQEASRHHQKMVPPSMMAVFCRDIYERIDVMDEFLEHTWATMTPLPVIGLDGSIACPGLDEAFADLCRGVL